MSLIRHWQNFSVSIIIPFVTQRIFSIANRDATPFIVAGTALVPAANAGGSLSLLCSDVRFLHGEKMRRTEAKGAN